MKNRASLTAEYMALFRALESSKPERSRLFCDPLAAIFLRQWRKWLYGIAQLYMGRRLVQQLLDRNAPGARAAGIACTKWIDGVLREIGQATVGSILLFTYVHRGVLDRPELFLDAEKLMSKLRSYGEPWTFGLYPENLESFLAVRGLRSMIDLSVAEVWKSTGRPGADTRGYEFYRLAAARVQGSE